MTKKHLEATGALGNIFIAEGRRPSVVPGCCIARSSCGCSLSWQSRRTDPLVPQNPAHRIWSRPCSRAHHTYRQPFRIKFPNLWKRCNRPDEAARPRWCASHAGMAQKTLVGWQIRPHGQRSHEDAQKCCSNDLADSKPQSLSSNVETAKRRHLLSETEVISQVV